MALSDLFSKKKTVRLEDIRSPEAKTLGKTYLQTLQEATQGYKPGVDFGSVSVGLTEPEKQSMGYLSDYLSSDITKSNLYQAGRGEITDTLSGDKYDPATGQYYKATRAAMDLSTQQAIDAARRGQAARGAFRSSGGLREEGDILTQSNILNQKLLAELAERERERRSTAGTQALQLAEFEQKEPLSKAQYAQQFGALQRENEIANLTREYNKWKSQREELMSAFVSAGQASNQGQPVYGKTSYETTERTGAGKLLDVAATGLGYYFGGPTGAKMGYGLSSML